MLAQCPERVDRYLSQRTLQTTTASVEQLAARAIRQRPLADCCLPLPSPCGGHTARVKTIDVVLQLDLLSEQQHSEIASWVRAGRTPEAIMAMPPHLWTAIEAAIAAMNIDADQTRPPLLGAGWE